MSKQRQKDSHVVRIYNQSKQTIPLETCPPGGDFYRHRQQIQLRPNKWVDLPKSFLNIKQIENLTKKRFIKVLYDSESRQERVGA